MPLNQDKNRLVFRDCSGNTAGGARWNLGVGGSDEQFEDRRFDEDEYRDEPDEFDPLDSGRVRRTKRRRKR